MSIRSITHSKVRTIAALALGAGVLVGGSSLPAQAAPAAPAAVKACANADLSLSYRAGDAGAGHRYGKVILTNVSGHACRTGGYGGLSYVGGGNGTQIGAAATRTPGKVRSLVVRPGGRLISEVDEMVAQNYTRKTCRPAKVDGFRIYAPNQTKSQYVAHPTTGCRNGTVHLIAHRAFARP